MAIRYCLQHVTNNISSKENAKFSIRTLVNRRIESHEVAAAIEQSSTFSKADVRGIICALANYIEQALLHGESVSLEGIGIFSSTARLKKEASQPQGIRAEGIGFNKITFLAASELKNKMKTAQYQYEPNSGIKK